jgi:hypothetical protein
MIGRRREFLGESRAILAIVILAIVNFRFGGNVPWRENHRSDGKPLVIDHA